MVKVMYHLYFLPPCSPFLLFMLLFPLPLLFLFGFPLPPPPTNILKAKCCHLHYFFFFTFINITLLPPCERILAAIRKTVQSLLDTFAELQNRKLSSSCLSVRLSVHLSICMRQLGSHWMDFH